MAYTGKKFYPDEDSIRIVEDCWGYKTEKVDFKMTIPYARYLKEQRRLKELREIEVYKHNLDEQMKLYNEVDQIDLNYFIYITTKYNNEYCTK